MGMILSSADILRILGGDAIVRQEARVEIVKDRPGLGTDDTVYVYVEKYPLIEEFEAVWRIWILDNSGMGQYVLNALTSLLPSFEFNGDHYTVREFASERTVVKSQAEKDHEELQRERVELRTELSGLQAGVEDRLKAVRDGVDGKDGKDGRDGADGRDGKDGRDGRDGKDMVATDAGLFDLKDVERGIPLKKGQVLMWDGSDWTNLYVPQFQSIISGGGGTGGTGDGENVIISDTAPATRDDGSELQEGDQWWDSSTGTMYVWYVDANSSQWVQSSGDGGNTAQPTSLNDLTDVVIDPEILDKDQGLMFDGTEWVVGTPPVLIEVHNQTGSTIPKGTPVYVAGTHSSGKALVAPADNDGAGTHPAFGLTHEDVVDGIDGHVMLSGLLEHVDTSAYSSGQALYLSSTPGVLTNVRPSGVTQKVQKVGLVTRVHANNGSILIIGAGRTNDINNELVALVGMGDKDATNLGTFAGSIISDNTDVKTALQQLEATIEALQAANAALEARVAALEGA